MPNIPVNYTGNEGAEPQVWEVPSGTRSKYSRGTSVEHWPCGHWHKKPLNINIDYNID